MKISKSMVVMASSVLALIAGVATTPAAFAISPYDSGWNHGVSDAHGGHYYATPGKGPEYHTPAFREGYIDGWCWATGGAGSDADYATFDCSDPTHYTTIKSKTQQEIGQSSDVNVKGNNNRVVVNQQANTGADQPISPGYSVYGSSHSSSKFGSQSNPRCLILCANVRIN
jgi:hypothetical protein